MNTPLLNPFFRHLGFLEDPFQSTNASDEPRIHEYFIEPPYFASVLGNPGQPKSQVILAPRGGGKTAQRIMVERDASRKRSYLCITYDHFDRHFDAGKLNTSLYQHLSEIEKYILVALLLDMAERTDITLDLGKSERAILRWQVDNWLNDFSALSFETSIKSLSTWSERLSDLWRRYSGQISSLISAVAQKYNLGPVDLTLTQEISSQGTARYHLGQQINIARKLGYQSIYVLVDRIDETAWTNQDADASFRLICPLVTDLQTLETPGLAFKFFLWDQIKDIYFDAGARRDRVKVFELRWNVSELERMLSQRLKSFSDGRVLSFNDMCAHGDRVNVHRLVSHIGAGSPRDVIRACGRIVDEHTRTSADQTLIKPESIMRGVRTFCEERADELYGTHIEQIRRVGHLTFTINQIASDVFRITAQAARQKIGQWVNVGACTKIDEVENPGSRPLYLYGITDPRLALACVPRDDLELVMGNYMFLCRECGSVAISDRDEIICNCGARSSLERATSMLQDCTL